MSKLSIDQIANDVFDSPPNVIKYFPEASISTLSIEVCKDATVTSFYFVIISQRIKIDSWFLVEDFCAVHINFAWG